MQIKSDLVVISNKFEEVNDNFRVTAKKLDSTSTTMRAYAKQSNAGIFLELAGQVEAYNEMVQGIIRLVEDTKDAAVQTHNRDQKIISSFTE